MTTPSDGGPAFPVPNDANVNDQMGMTLRDAFAQDAAGHIWTQFQQDGTAREHPEWRHGVAVEAYRLADELLAVR